MEGERDGDRLTDSEPWKNEIAHVCEGDERDGQIYCRHRSTMPYYISAVN